jgi:PPOX class probable F420-dependent enzyme
VAVLATSSNAGPPHVVPITFALHGDTLYTAVDHKPKESRALTRVANIDANPLVSVLVHSYSNDWSSLWWCRLDGEASIHKNGLELASAREHLVAKYEQYSGHKIEGPAIVVRIDRAVGWEAG